MDTMNHYDGSFDPDFDLSRLSRAALARLGREYMLFNHLHDRSWGPIVAMRFGPQALTDVAVDEWMGSSPIYNARNRKNLKIEGNGVSAVLKAFQVDIGAPHHFLDFRFELVDETFGYFWLEYCGAYEGVHTMTGGHPDFIKQLCWDMEDTTFPTTTMAVNPKIHCLPIHRPPLPEDHTGPVCRWEVSLSDQHETIEKTEICKIVEQSKAAQFELPALPGRSSEGMDDYSGPFKPDFGLEDLSHPALIRQCKEFMLDVHLLIRACMISISRRWGDKVMKEIAREQWLAVAPVYVERIRKTLNMQGDDMDEILKMLQVDPALPHDYVDFGCRLVNERHGYFWINDCDAISEGEQGAWLIMLSDADAPGFDAVVEAVNPKARCRPTDPSKLASNGGRPVYAWEIIIDDEAEPRDRSKITEPSLVDQLRTFKHRP